MTTWANEMRAAALNGMTALLNGGTFRLLDAGASELAAPVFNATAFGAATNANPSVATANTFTADSSITAGTIASFELRTSGGSTRVSGSVGVGTGDIQVSSTTIPGTATSVTISGMTISFSLT